MNRGRAASKWPEPWLRQSVGLSERQPAFKKWKNYRRHDDGLSPDKDPMIAVYLGVLFGKASRKIIFGNQCVQIHVKCLGRYFSLHFGLLCRNTCRFQPFSVSKVDIAISYSLRPLLFRPLLFHQIAQNPQNLGSVVARLVCQNHIGIQAVGPGYVSGEIVDAGEGAALAQHSIHLG